MLACYIFCMETNELTLSFFFTLFMNTTGGFISSGALDYYRQVCLIKIGTELHADRPSGTGLGTFALNKAVLFFKPFFSLYWKFYSFFFKGIRHQLSNLTCPKMLNKTPGLKNTAAYGHTHSLCTHGRPGLRINVVHWKWQALDYLFIGSPKWPSSWALIGWTQD